MPDIYFGKWKGLRVLLFLYSHHFVNLILRIGFFFGGVSGLGRATSSYHSLLLFSVGMHGDAMRMLSLYDLDGCTRGIP